MNYVEKEKPLNLSAYAKGSVLHDLIEHFWERIGRSEEVVKSGRSPARYSNAEEFADYARRKWFQRCIMSENSGRQIAWSFGNEQWVIAKNMENICHHLFPVLLEEGQPLLSEVPFEFRLLGKIFRGKIDEVRLRNGKPVVRDYKSGKPYMGEMKLDFDPQLTIYNVAIGAMISQDREFAKTLGLESRINDFMGNVSYTVPELEQEFFMVEAPFENHRRREEGKEELQIIHSTTRTDNHFLEVIKMIDSVQERINQGQIVAERGHKCDYCDLKHACKKRLEDIGIGFYEDRQGQFNLEFVVPDFAKKNPESKTKRRKKDPNQLHFTKGWRYTIETNYD